MQEISLMEEISLPVNHAVESSTVVVTGSETDWTIDP